MSQGYTLRLIQRNEGADMSMLGVRLGRACMRHDISVIKVADEFGVSRATVYNWFTGHNDPAASISPAIEKFIDKLNAGAA